MKGATNPYLVVLAAVVLSVGAFYVMSGGKFGGTTYTVTPTTVPVPGGVQCTSNTQPSLTYSAANSYTGAAVQGASGALRYRILGSETWTQTTLPATITGSAGQVLEMGVLDENTTWNGVTDVYTMPCESYPKREVKVSPIATATSVTATIWNPDGTVNSNGTNALNMAAGDIKNFKLQLTGVYQSDWGDVSAGENSNIMVCFANKSSISNLVIPSLQSAGFVPSTAYVGTNDTYAFKVPIIKSNQDTPVYTMTVTASSSVTPTGGPVQDSDDIVCDIYDSGLYLDGTYTNKLGFGVQDENRADHSGSASEVNFKVSID
jgi:hypothetical protein